MSNNKLYLHNIDLNKNQIINPVLHNATTAPSTPVDGQMYYNTTEKSVYYYNNSEWKKLGGITGGTTNYLVKYSAADAITASTIYDDGTNIGIGTTSPIAKFHVLGNTYFEDTTTRSTISTGVRGNPNFKFTNIIDSSINSGVVPFGTNMHMLYQFKGSIGSTVWGNNVFWPQRRVIDINSSMNLNNGTYILNGNNNFPNASLMYAINVGSNDNSTTVPLDITVGSAIETGMIGSLARMDFFPNNDSGVSLKYFKGIYSTYVSFFDFKSATGSTHDTIIHYAGGSYRHLGGVQIDNMIGVFIASMKNSSTGQFISNSYAFSQDGVNDKNYFAGGAVLGTQSFSGSALLQINSTTKGFLFPRMTSAQKDLIYKDTLTIAIDTPGSGYVDGTYTKRYVSPNTTTTGIGMTVNVTVAGGVVTNVQLVVLGTNYAVDDLLTVTKEQLNSPSGSGFKFKVVSLVDYPVGLTIYQTDGTEGLYTRRAGTTASWERFITTYDLSSTNLFLNSSSSATFIGYSSEPGTAGTYKFGVNGTSLFNNDLLVYKNAFNYIGLYAQADASAPYIKFFYSGALDARLYVVSAATNIGAKAVQPGFGVYQTGNTIGVGFVASTIGATGGMIGVTNTNGDAIFHIASPNGYSGFISFRENGVADKGLIGYANGSNDLQIRVNGATTMITGTNAATFYNNGNVGIGTTATPSYKFEVNGTARFGGDTYCGQDILISFGSGTRYIQSPNGSIGFLSTGGTYGYTLWTQNNRVGIQNKLTITTNNTTAQTDGGPIILANVATQTSPSTFGAELSFGPHVNHAQTYVAIRGADAGYGSTTTTPVSLYIFGGQNTTNSVYGNIYLAHDFSTPRGSVGIGTNSINSKAILQIDSTTKGFLPPRMTGAQAEAIAPGASEAGLLVFANSGNGTTINLIGWWGWTGSAWVKLN